MERLFCTIEAEARTRMPTDPHPFDLAIRLAPTGENRCSGSTSPAYANMVGPFGGITCAVLLQSVLVHAQRQGDPVALTVNFAAPIADGAFEIEARPVRTNRSTQHWIMQLTQKGAVAASATAVLAVRRPTWSAPEAVPPSGMPEASTLERMQRPGMPAWLGRYDLRFDEGSLPASFDHGERAHSRSALWVRDEPPRPLDFPSLAAICDSFFPRIYLRRRSFVPVGTVSLTTFFHADAERLAAQSDRHVLGVARAMSYHNGFFDQNAEIWSDDGRLLAGSHQIVYYRE